MSKITNAETTQYAIINEAGEYLRVFNVDFATGSMAAAWTSIPPFQAVTNRESAEKVMGILAQRPVIDWSGTGKEPRIVEAN